MDLLGNPVFVLLAIVLLGEALGRVQFKAFSLGSSAIVLVALAAGHLGYTLPPVLRQLGLVLFVYSIAVQAGPGILTSFRSDGLRLSLAALGIVATGFLAALGCAALFGFDAATAAGVFAGALTSTPGLAVAVESAGSGAAAAYGLTYSFGVVGVILFVKLLPALLRVDLPAEEALLDAERQNTQPPMTFVHLEVSNPNLFGRSLADLHLPELAPVTITRVLRREAAEPVLASATTTLREGDRVRIVGRASDLETVELLIGRRVEAEIEFDRVLSKRTLVVSKPEAVGQTVGSMNFRAVFNVQVSRIERNGIELPVLPTTHLHRGDLLHVVGDERSLGNVARQLGNDVKATQSLSLLSLFAGIFLGFALGQIPLYLPVVGELRLGTTGGVLLAGLVLSSLHKTGPFVWEPPATGNDFIRRLGLVLFLASVGTSAGKDLAATLAQHGLPLLGAGVAVTLLPLVVCTLLLRPALRLRFLRLLGVLTGGMTSTPGLAAATSISATPYAAAAYATVYPTALVAMILFTKALVLVLH